MVVFEFLNENFKKTFHFKNGEKFGLVLSQSCLFMSIYPLEHNFRVIPFEQ